jgi:oligopeptidase B
MLKPPIAKQRPQTYHLHDDTRIDNYAWLRDRETDPDVLAYLTAENAYTKEHMQPTLALQEQLFEEMRGRIQLADSTVPFYEDNYYYYWRTTETNEYHILCRRHEELSAPEEIILDENLLAHGQDYFHLGDYDISPNQRYLAYTQDTEGKESHVLCIKDLQTQETITTDIKHIAETIIWTNDNKTLFFVKLDETWRPHEVYTYDTVTKQTRLCYIETDAAFLVDIHKCKTQQYILLETASKNTTEVHFLPADKPLANFTCLYPRQEDVKYSVTPSLDSWYIRTSLNAKNFRVVKVPMNDAAVKNWQEIIPHHADVKIEELEIFRNFLVIVERKNAQLHLRVLNLLTGENQLLSFPEDIYSIDTIDNVDFNSTILRVAYASLTTPRTIYDINLYTHERLLLKQTQVLGGFNSSDYRSERLYASAQDGTLIPISIVYHRNTPLNGTAPLYLYGYGAYGLSLNPWFSTARLSLLNRGVIFAVVHARGGGDNGEYWYEAGKLLQKKHTFDDFICCGEHLLKLHYSTKEKLIICGGSAGGILVGAVLNQCPDFCALAIAHVPFVDVLNTMMDPTLPLTIGEYQEWGNPLHEEFYYYIKSYSPYDNVHHNTYPTLLVTAGLSDPRVQYWEPAKWVAKLRAHKTDKNPLLLRMNMTAGHQGASGRFAALKEVAFEYAFIFHELKIAFTSPLEGEVASRAARGG